MNKKNIGFRSLTQTFIAMLALSLWIPSAFAVNVASTVSALNVSPDPFYTSVPNVSPYPTTTLSYNLNKGGYASSMVTEQVKDADGNIVYYWGTDIAEDTKTDADGTINLTWDGKANTGSGSGQFVPTGTYTFYVKSHVGTPPDSEATKTFKVEKTVVPSINLFTAAPAIYYKGTGNYTLNYVLAIGSGSTPIVHLTINGPKNNSPKDVILTKDSITQDGNYTIEWDGKINGTAAPEGDYSFKLNATNLVNGNTISSTDINGTFKVSNNQQPSPAISDVKATPVSFDNNKESVGFSYNLNNSLGLTTINAAVYLSTDLNKAIQSWQFTTQASGSNTITWDGKDKDKALAKEGNYIFKVWGTDGSFSLVPQQVSFTISPVVTPVPTDEKCEGFTDLKATDADCEAVKYVKSLGAMTGNPDGTFAPDDILQRDQVAKIVLETFGLFNKQTDYCLGTAAFPDVLEAEWSYQYICQGKILKMITGYVSGVDNGFYRPARTVNRVEFLALVLRNLDETMPADTSTSYSDVEAGNWYSGYAKFAKDNSLFTGSKLNPTNFVSRREVASIIYKLHQKGKI
jgi:flagellar hook assembly protein FlgD